MSTYFGEKTKISENSIDSLVERFKSQEFDLVAVGRMLLANPDWPQKISKGRFDEVVQFSKEHTEKLY